MNEPIPIDPIIEEQQQREKMLGDWSAYSLTVDVEELFATEFCCAHCKKALSGSFLAAATRRFPRLVIYERSSFAVSGPNERACLSVQQWLGRNYPVSNNRTGWKLDNSRPEGEAQLA